ncbi:unnamed protein product [Diamesa serratosioi]
MSKLFVQILKRVVVQHNRKFAIEKLTAAPAIMGEKATDNNLLNSREKWFNKYEEITLDNTDVFKGVQDRFNGVTVDSSTEALSDEKSFDEMLTKSLEFWIDQKRRAIWFRVHHKDAAWVPVLAKNEFYFHHARDKFVMMYRWLPKDESLIIPPFAHTMVGCGALVINENNQILVVSEKNALIKNSWKLPGGYLEMTAIREVEEETNIKTKFESVICIRHAHGAAFNCSDMYIVMSLKPETTDIKKCEREIAKCMWMDVDEYLSHPNVHKTNRGFLQNYLENKEAGISITCAEEVHQVLNRKYNLYYAKKT